VFQGVFSMFAVKFEHDRNATWVLGFFFASIGRRLPLI
jgi:hypothetical protein